MPSENRSYKSSVVKSAGFDHGCGDLRPKTGGIDHGRRDLHGPKTVVKSAGFDHGSFPKPVFDHRRGDPHGPATVVKNGFKEETVVKSRGFDHGIGAMMIARAVVNSC